MRVSPAMERACLKLAGELPASKSREPAERPPRVRLIIELPGVVVKSEANIRGKIRETISRKGEVKESVREAMPAPFTSDFPRPTTVKLVRVGGKRMDDDNLAHSFKVVRDVVSEWLGVDDGDTKSVRWEYEQESGYVSGIRIEIG